MIEIEIRPSLNIVRQIAAIERLCGRWERLSQSPSVASSERLKQALNGQALAAFFLDSSTTTNSSIVVETSAHPESKPIRKDSQYYLDCYHQEIDFDLSSLLLTFAGLLENKDSLPQKTSLTSPFRQESLHCCIRSRSLENELVAFPTLAPFLIEQRLSALYDWALTELEDQRQHPLFVVAIFHLLFLQISPFPRYNVALAQLITWKLMVNFGFELVCYAPFSPAFLERADTYVASLRQAEKSSFSSWTTLNTWLEFFFGVLVELFSDVISQSERSLQNARLTQAQKHIVDVVRKYGSVSREKIVSETEMVVSTVKYNLSVLTARGHLKREGNGRTTSYRAI